MKIIFLVTLIATIALVDAEYHNGGHLFTPTTNIVSSRTIIGSAVGGGPSSGAVSASHYSQTVAAPATVHTIITSHPGTNFGYSGTNTGGGDRGSSPPNQHGGGSNNDAYGNYAYSSSGPGGSNIQGGSSGQSGYGRVGGSSGSGGGQSPATFGHPQPSYYNQRHY